MRRIRITAALLVAGSLLLTVLSSFPAFAKPITIKGKRLAEIDDIVETVTSSDFSEIQKHSLLFFERFKEGSEIVYQPRVFTISKDGSMKKEYILDAQHLDERHRSAVAANPTSYIVQKTDLAISPKRFGMRRNVVYTNSGLVLDGSNYSVTGFQTVESNGVEDAASITTPDEKDPQWYWGERRMWGNAAMTIKGMEDKDIYVIANSNITYNSSGNLSKIYLYFLGVDRNESGSLSSHHIPIKGGDQYFGIEASELIPGLRGVDVAAGDFDGDGYKNEVLLVWHDSYGVYAYVFKITTRDGETLESTGMMTEKDTIYINPVPDPVEWIDVDYPRQSSLVALAGDFDGDGVEEAAAVTRIDDVHSALHKSAMRKVTLKVLKYKNSYSWTSAELTPYLTPYADFFWTLKATKADLNGDGQDEIVILVFSTLSSESKIYPRLEFWGFEPGSIQPVRNEHCNKGGIVDTTVDTSVL